MSEQITTIENGAKILINKVNFKNKENDWLEIYYKSPTEKEINLKGLTFKSDKIIKKIEQDFWIKSGTHLTLTFKSNQADTNTNLYTNYSGLTGTTEQVTINLNDQILDAICWSSSTPASSEIKDQQKLKLAEAWISGDPISCIESEKVENSQSVVRKNIDSDTNSVNDWKIDEVQKNAAHIGAAKKSILKKASSKATTKTVPNGDLSNQIVITEIFPHALKDDRSNEWIEIQNQSNKDINLSGWRLDDTEGGSKPYLIKNLIIKAHEFIIFTSKQTKLSLGNSKDEARLFDYKNNLISSISYEEAAAGKSYSKVPVAKEDLSIEQKWLWVNPTPAAANPEYKEIIGTIKSEPNSYFFSFQDSANQIKNINFNESLVPLALAKTTFIPGAKAKINVTAAKNPEELQLENYEILSDSNGKSVTSSRSYIALFILLLSICVFIIIKIKKHFKTEPESINLIS